MKIPDKITIAGREIKIEWQDVELNKQNVDGIAEYHADKIKLSRRLDLEGSPEAVEATFIHEIIHWIIYLIHYEAADNEDFIWPFGELLYQVIKQLIKGDKK